MTNDTKPKRLFKVASEFNVATASIVETLAKQGFEIDNKPNSKITPDMYAALDSVYGDDKAKSREHERAREEYAERRNTMRSARNESVSIDNFLEPEDALAPAEEKKISPEDSLLDPIDEEESKAPEPEPKQEKDSKPEPAPEPKKEPEVEPEPEPVAKKSEEKKFEKAPEEPVAKKTETKKADEPVAEKEEVKEPKKQVEEVEDKEVSTQADADEEADTEAAADESEEAVSDDDEPQDVIRGRAGRLSGTKILGKMSVKDSSEAAGRSKKKKKKTKEAAEKEKAEDEAAKGKKKKIKAKRVLDDKTDDASKRKKKRIKGKGKGAGKKKEIESSDVESKLKETMQMMQGGTAKKRQKRRRQRRDEKAAEREIQALESEMEQEVLEVTEYLTVSDLADMLEVSSTEIITLCMNLGMMVSINQRLEAGTIELIADEYERDIKFVDAEEVIEEEEEEDDDPEDLKPRAPVVTVMGHVDHGKTSLLDYIRKTKVTAGEAGGITQHIGAHAVKTDDGREITFLDTPGHEAFTAMRARGAQVTDIVILVVAADDSVMPQTIEAINHAQAAGVPIVVAVNKMDKEGANPDRIKQQLSEHNVLVEEWGGSVQLALVSAHTGLGIDEMLEKVLIEAELMELKANPDRRATGIVLESRVDKGKGVVANILVQKGTLKVGDPFVAGPHYGRVRAFENEFGVRMQEVGPSMPAQLTGFDGLPQAGDKVTGYKDEKAAKEVALQRQKIKREQELRRVKHVTLDDISRRMALGELVELNLIIKGDVDGSIEALSGSLQKLTNDEVKVNAIHTGVGAITESDVLLASASDAIIIGFQVRPSSQARKLAEKEEIDIRLFSVIYDAVDAVHDALEGMLSPELGEKITATVEIRETFKVPSVGTIAGCMVTEGKIHRNSKVRVIRDGIVIYDGELASLKRFKDDAKEVASGYECGMNIHNFNDIKVGDIIEGYEITETKRKLSI